MGASSLKAGQQLRILGADYVVLRKLEKNIWQVEAISTRRVIEYTTLELMEFYHRGDMIFVGSEREIVATGDGQKATDFNDEQFETAKVKRLLVLEILGLPSTKKVVTPIIENRWSELGLFGKCPSASSVLRWKQNYVRANGDITALIDQNFRKGNRKLRYDEFVYATVRSTIENVYLTLERKTQQDVLDEAKHRIRRENQLRPKQFALPYPSLKLVKKLISEVPAFDRVAARFGRTAATNRFRAALGQHVADFPLERAEIDHTPLDVIVIDDDTFLPLGRPWLTVCLDVRTRSLLGRYVGFEPPSYLSVARCLKHAFLPKTDLRSKYPSIQNEWLPHGVMQELVVDGGPEFHSKSLENVCYSLGTEIHYSARKTPWHKGKVERFIKTLNDSVSHKIPGTTFSNILEKDDYDPVKHAVVRFSKLLEITDKWVADVYHQKIHRSLHTSPQQDWIASIAPEDIMLPDDPTVLDALLGRSETRTLTHKGIELDCLFYNSPELTDLRKRYGEKLKNVEIRIDDADIGELTVICPKTGDLFNVPAIRADYASGTSRWQHRVFKRYAADRDDRADPEAWLEAKHDISEMVAEEFEIKKKGTRSRTARFKHGVDGLSESATHTDNNSDVSKEHYSPLENDTAIEEPIIDDDLTSNTDIEFKNIAPVVSFPTDTNAALEN